MINKIYNKVLKHFGLVRITPNKYGTGSYQDMLFSKNNIVQPKKADTNRIVPVDTFADTLIENYTKNGGDFSPDNERWTIADIFFRRNGLNKIDNAILVFHSDQKDNIYRYAEEEEEEEVA